MRMIPDTPYGTLSSAEKRVFDRLRSALTSATDGNCIAYHSLNLTRHSYKRFGEIDFLICGPKGIYVLEVKGGRVACKNAVWTYTNRYGDLNESKEGPFKQSESALHGLIKRLKEKFPLVINQFSIGFGVVVPDCEMQFQGAEWDPKTLLDAHGFNNFENWLKKLFTYWRDKDGGKRTPTDTVLKEFHQFLRPEFEAVIPLYVQAQGAGESIAILTEDQMSMVDIVAANNRVLCSGGAGTGKTFIAMELARRWTAEGMNVVLVCRSPWLKNYLDSRFAIANLTVSLVGSVRNSCQRKGLDSFDALIVDEGQDIFDMSSLDNLDNVLNGGLVDGRWCIFHDVNNQSGFFGSVDQEAIEYLKSTQPMRVPLTTNCRNTLNILKKVQTSLLADMGVKGAGPGPAIREHKATSKEESACLLQKELEELIKHGGLSPGNVTILSPYPIIDSCVYALPEKIKREIDMLDEYSLRNFPSSKISYAQIANFKGLENEAIILVDLPAPTATHDQRTIQHYVGMSRARSVLTLIQMI